MDPTARMTEWEKSKFHWLWQERTKLMEWFLNPEAMNVVK